MFIDHFAQKGPVISGSCVERDLQFLCGKRLATETSDVTSDAPDVRSGEIARQRRPIWETPGDGPKLPWRTIINGITRVKSPRQR